jgi:hypothetical protein
MGTPRLLAGTQLKVEIAFRFWMSDLPQIYWASIGREISVRKGERPQSKQVNVLPSSLHPKIA